MDDSDDDFLGAKQKPPPAPRPEKRHSDGRRPLIQGDALLADDDGDDLFAELAITPPEKRPSKETLRAKLDKERRRPPPTTKVKEVRFAKEPSVTSVPSTSAKERAATGKDSCPICSKDLAHLSDTRQMLHINACLDGQEAKTRFERAKDKHEKTIDCPICRKPQPEGPFRAAHIKKCAREFSVPASDAMRLLETQKKVAEKRKERSLPHNSASEPVFKEVRPPPLRGAPRSIDDEQVQLAKALSASLEQQDSSHEEPTPPPAPRSFSSSEPAFSIVSEASRRMRKRRSYDIIAFAPESCVCKQMHEAHARFLDVFRIRKTNGNVVPLSDVTNRRRRRTEAMNGHMNEIYAKLSRLYRLSADLRSLADPCSLSLAPLQILCRGGGLIDGMRELIQRRTTLLKGKPTSIEQIEIDFPQEIVREWLRYVYAARVEWTMEQSKQIATLAEQFGPEDLLLVCKRRSGEVVEEPAPPAEVPFVGTPVPSGPVELTGVARKAADDVNEDVDVVNEERWESSQIRASERSPSGKTTDEIETLVPPVKKNLTPINDSPPRRIPQALNDSDSSPKTLSDIDFEDPFLGVTFGESSEHVNLEPTTSGCEEGKTAPNSFLMEKETPVSSEVVREVNVAGETRSTSSSLKISPTVSEDNAQRISPKRPTARRISSDDDCIIVNEHTNQDSPIKTETGVLHSPDVTSAILTASTDSKVVQKRKSLTQIPRDSFDESVKFFSQPERSPDLFGEDDDVMVCSPPTPKTTSPQLRLRSSNPTESVASFDRRSFEDVSYVVGRGRHVEQCTVDTEATTNLNVDAGLEAGTSFTIDHGTPFHEIDEDFVDGHVNNGHDPISSSLTLATPHVSICLDDVTPSLHPTTATFPTSTRNVEPQQGGSTVDEDDEYIASAPNFDSFDFDHGFTDCGGGGALDMGGDEFQWDPEPERVAPTPSTTPTEQQLAEAVEVEANPIDSFDVSPDLPKPRRRSKRSRGGLSVKDDAREEAPQRSHRPERIPPCPPSLANVPPLAQSTPIAPASKRTKFAFGSNVKVLKTHGVTPMPDFGKMSDKEVEAQLSKFGLRKVGRKRAEALLAQIYENTHPVIDEEAAASTSAPRSAENSGSRGSGSRKGDNVEEAEDNEDELTRSGGEDNLEETMILDGDLPKDLDGMQRAFLQWLRHPDQCDIYLHLLALKPVAFEELYIRVRRADASVCKLSRKALQTILDRLHVFFSLPQNGHRR